MIPDLQSSLICDDVRQERNGKFILIGLFDMVGAPQFPSPPQRLCIVNRWCCGEGDFIQRCRILRPDNTVLIHGKEVPVKLPGSEANATTVEIFMNVRFDVAGVYWVEILLGDDLKLRYPLGVRQVNPPQQPKG